MAVQNHADKVVDNRPKNFLTEAEITSFLESSRKGRHGVRNYAMALLAFRHGLRVSELINMRTADLDLDTGHLFVRRLKGSLSTSQPLHVDEIRALRRWLRRRVNAPCCNSPLVFLSERGPMTRQAFNLVLKYLGLADNTPKTWPDFLATLKRFGPYLQRHTPRAIACADVAKRFPMLRESLADRRNRNGYPDFLIEW